MNNLSMPKLIANSSTYYGRVSTSYVEGDGDYDGDKYMPGGEVYESHKKDDVWITEELCLGFVEVNSSLAWSCVFSDLSGDVIDKYVQVGPNIKEYAYLDAEYWEGMEDELAWLKKELAVKNILDIESIFIMENIDNCKWSVGRSDEYVEYVDELLQQNYINIGAEETRCYTSLSDACFEFLYKLNRDKIRCRLDEEEWHDYWRYARGEIKTVCCSGPLEFYSEHAQEFISWVINAGNEAQKYASYARAHCPSLLVKMLYDHVFSIEALEVIRDSWAGRAFYISKTEGFDWSYVKAQRQLAMTGSCDCPV